MNKLMDIQKIAVGLIVLEEPAKKRRKKEYTVALLMAYQGKKYNGMQVRRYQNLEIQRFLK